MLSKNGVQIVEFLLRNPTSQYNVNQISRELKISVGSAHKILKYLYKKDIVILFDSILTSYKSDKSEDR